ncbi:GumC family protein [Altericroceibacterium spongiae]|uniref:GumC family protein n=1 Tax=Altericroceibacterium spongiae TaxID=2320269 RepID=UPI0016001FF9|nr:polysaccharide biosynthesis tyrosine autokinase [Altericroceibacterium spongiae]
MAERVAERLNMLKDDAVLIALTGGRANDSRDAEHRKNRVIQKLREGLSVHLSDKSQIIGLSFESPDPALSRAVTNAYIAAFVTANVQQQFDSTRYAQRLLTERLREMRKELAYAEKALNKYARQHDLLRAGGTAMGEADDTQQSMLGAALGQINEVLGEARAARIEAQSRWEAVVDSDPLTSPEVLASPAIQQLLQRQANVEAELEKGNAIYLPDHPDIRRLQAERKALKSQISRLANTIRASIGETYQAALTRENELVMQLRNLRGESLDENDASVAYNILAREAAAKRSQYRALLDRYNGLNNSSNTVQNNIAVIDEASLSMEPSSPRLLISGAVALMAGFALAAVWTLWRSQGDDTLRMSQDLSDKIGLPVLGMIPASEAGLSPMQELENGRSALSEAYNALRTALTHSTAKGLPPVLLITSVQAGEGKSVTSYAIALAFARLGVNTLLVDVDLRRPALHHLLDCLNDDGLSRALEEGVDPLGFIKPAGKNHLFRLTAGPVPDNPTDLLSDPRFETFLDNARLYHEVVILDGPPVVGLADAPIIGSLADGTILVTEANRTTIRACETAAERLRCANNYLLGTVLTKFTARSVGRHLSYQDREYWRYGVGARAFDAVPAGRV